jgi:signal peptidase I
MDFCQFRKTQSNSGFIYIFQGLTDAIAKDIKALPEVTE